MGSKKRASRKNGADALRLSADAADAAEKNDEKPSTCHGVKGVGGRRLQVQRGDGRDDRPGGGGGARRELLPLVNNKRLNRIPRMADASTWKRKVSKNEFMIQQRFTYVRTHE